MRRNVEWVVDHGDDESEHFPDEFSAAVFASENAPSTLSEKWEEPEGFRNSPSWGGVPVRTRLVRRYE